MKILQLIDQYKTGGAEKVYDLFSQYCLSKGYTTNRIIMYGELSVHSSEEYLMLCEHTSILQKLFDHFACIKILNYIIKERSVDHIVSFLDRSNLVVIFALLFDKKRPTSPRQIP